MAGKRLQDPSVPNMGDRTRRISAGIGLERTIRNSRPPHSGKAGKGRGLPLEPPHPIFGLTEFFEERDHRKEEGQDGKEEKSGEQQNYDSGLCKKRSATMFVAADIRACVVPRQRLFIQSCRPGQSPCEPPPARRSLPWRRRSSPRTDQDSEDNTIWRQRQTPARYPWGPKT